MQGWLTQFVGRKLSLGFGGGTSASGSRPLRRRFLRYDLMLDGEDGLLLVDRYEEYDYAAGRYVAKECRTQLRPEEGHPVGYALADDRARSELAARLSELRREVDAAGMKIFFDPQPDGGLRPKWRYRCGGRWRTELMRVIDEPDAEDPYRGDPDAIPSELLRLVMADCRYYLTAEWNSWFGRRMQRKRELVVLDAALDLLPG
ncbi:MAG: hypothetical protein ABIJ46_00485 [bacterium]